MQTTQKLFYNACRSGNLATVQRVCELNELAMRTSRGRCRGPVNMAATGSKCIWLAAEAGHLAVLRYLCELALTRPATKLNPAAFDNRALWWAACNGHVHVVKYLCGLAVAHPVLGIASPRQCCLTRVVAESERLDMMQTLSELGAAYPALGINVAADDNETLIIAAFRGRLSIVKYLCERPEVDPSRIVRIQSMWVWLKAGILETVHGAVAQRGRWTPARAAWVGAVAAAGTYNRWTR